MAPKKIRITGIIIMSLILVVGFCAAADNTTAETTTTATETAAVVSTATSIADNAGISTDFSPYNGPNGPGSALYGFRIAMEDLDETFTFNQTERLNKQVDHAQLRMREALNELQRNRTDSATQALDLYWQKLNQTETTLTPFGANSTGLLHAQEMIAKHQYVLEELQLSHPNNTGLMQAYNNSLRLQEKFEAKTAMKYGRGMDAGNQTAMNTGGMESELRNQTGKGDNKGRTVQEQDQLVAQENIRQNERDKANVQGNVTPARSEITHPARQQENRSQVTVSPQQTRRSSDNTSGQTGNGKSADPAAGNDNGKGRNK
jgi:hypothetical protein